MQDMAKVSLHLIQSILLNITIFYFRTFLQIWLRFPSSAECFIGKLGQDLKCVSKVMSRVALKKEMSSWSREVSTDSSNDDNPEEEQNINGFNSIKNENNSSCSSDVSSCNLQKVKQKEPKGTNGCKNVNHNSTNELNHAISGIIATGDENRQDTYQMQTKTLEDNLIEFNEKVFYEEMSTIEDKTNSTLEESNYGAIFPLKETKPKSKCTSFHKNCVSCSSEVTACKLSTYSADCDLKSKSINSNSIISESAEKESEMGYAMHELAADNLRRIKKSSEKINSQYVSIKENCTPVSNDTVKDNRCKEGNETTSYRGCIMNVARDTSYTTTAEDENLKCKMLFKKKLSRSISEDNVSRRGKRSEQDKFSAAALPRINSSIHVGKFGAVKKCTMSKYCGTDGSTNLEICHQLETEECHGCTLISAITVKGELSSEWAQENNHCHYFLYSKEKKEYMETKPSIYEAHGVDTLFDNNSGIACDSEEPTKLEQASACECNTEYIIKGNVQRPIKLLSNQDTKQTTTEDENIEPLIDKCLTKVLNGQLNTQGSENTKVSPTLPCPLRPKQKLQAQKHRKLDRKPRENLYKMSSKQLKSSSNVLYSVFYPVSLQEVRSKMSFTLSESSIDPEDYVSTTLKLSRVSQASSPTNNAHCQPHCHKLPESSTPSSAKSPHSISHVLAMRSSKEGSAV